jgi:hypothetical protein
MMCDGYAFSEVARKEIKTMTESSMIFGRILLIPSRTAELLEARILRSQK